MKRTAIILAFIAAIMAYSWWAIQAPAIYASPRVFEASIVMRGNERVLWINRFSILKIRQCDSGGDNGIFQVQYVRPVLGGFWYEGSVPSFNLYDQSGRPIRGTNRVGTDVGIEVVVEAGRWAEFPKSMDRFTKVQILVPCKLANGRWIYATWGPVPLSGVKQ